MSFVHKNLRRRIFALRKRINDTRKHMRKPIYRLAFASKMRQARPEPGCHSLVIVLDHLAPHGNPGKIVRSAVVLGAKEVHVVGRRYFNPVPAVNALRHAQLRFFDSLAASCEALHAQGYTLYALEPRKDTPAETYLDQLSLSERCAFIVGSETRGVSISPQEAPYVTWVSIRQFGKITSLNASIAASIAMYEYTRQHGAHLRVP